MLFHELVVSIAGSVGKSNPGEHFQKQLVILRCTDRLK